MEREESESVLTVEFINEIYLEELSAMGISILLNLRNVKHDLYSHL